MPQTVNDVHSRLNRTEVAEIARPRTVDEVRAALKSAAARGLGVSIAGCRHAMGGQQFGAGTLLLDMTAMNRPVALDGERGLLEIGAGADWPAIIRATHELQPGGARWAIRQKQTGADTLTLGGSIAANVHGRGLLMPPLGEDVESLTLVTADADVVWCSREENAELFSLAIGGYGLFGVVVSATLRLAPRIKVRRLVDIIDIDDALNAVRRRVTQGCIYGDFQYAIDPASDAFLRRGVFACYAPAPADAEVSDGSADLPREKWIELLRLAHTDKRRAFDSYCMHYLSTHERVYWSDTHQLGTYIPTYAEFLQEATGTAAGTDESLVIGELAVPQDRLVEFMVRARAVLRATEAEDIYGTIRSIRRDPTSFLAWARADYACVIFNLRTVHTPEGVERTAVAFRGLIDAAIDLGGCFYLTYHRFADRRQVEAAYPRFGAFLAKKREHDPRGVFQSDWYRHYASLFEGA